MEEDLVRQVVSAVLAQTLAGALTGREVPVEASARHVHLCQTDVEKLFGLGHVLTCQRELSQPGQFLAQERVSIVTAKGAFRNVAVLGPARRHTQVELSATDAKALDIDAPLRQSGDTVGSASAHILSEGGLVQAQEAVIIARNHIHMPLSAAVDYGVEDGQLVRVRLHTVRPLIFEEVVVRAHDDYRLAMHIDFDEANACLYRQGDTGVIIP